MLRKRGHTSNKGRSHYRDASEHADISLRPLEGNVK